VMAARETMKSTAGSGAVEQACDLMRTAG